MPRVELIVDLHPNDGTGRVAVGDRTLEFLNIGQDPGERPLVWQFPQAGHRNLMLSFGRSQVCDRQRADHIDQVAETYYTTRSTFN